MTAAHLIERLRLYPDATEVRLCLISAHNFPAPDTAIIGCSNAVNTVETITTGDHVQDTTLYLTAEGAQS